MKKLAVWTIVVVIGLIILGVIVIEVGGRYLDRYRFKGSMGIINSVVPTPIKIEQPKSMIGVTSPLQIRGHAPGGWYFEASFPVTLLDTKGAVLSQAPAQAQGEWMTTDTVPFEATLVFPSQPVGSKGRLVFAKDNPSDLPANDASYSMVVTF